MQYVTVARAQQNKALSNVSSAVLTDLIQAASAMVARYCDNDFTQQSYTDVLDGNGLDVIPLRQVGITAITSVTITEGATSTSLDTSNFAYEAGTGILGFAEDSTATYAWFPKGFQNVTVVYTAGEDEVPQDIQEATVQITYAMYAANASNVSPDKQQERMGEYSVTYRDASVHSVLSQAGVDLLAGHKRYEV